MAKITKDMLVVDILKNGDEEKLANVLYEHDMHCLMCILAHNETLEEAAMGHGVDVDELVAQLNAVAEG